MTERDEVSRVLAAIDEATGYVTSDREAGPDAMRVIPAATAEPERGGLAELCGEVIDAYSRGDAIADGVLVEAPAELVRRAGIAVPVTVTRAVWEMCVSWSERDDRETGALLQEQDGRWLDLLETAIRAGRAARPTGPAPVPLRLWFVPRGVRVDPDAETQSTSTDLVAVFGTDLDGSPCITVCLPGEE